MENETLTANRTVTVPVSDIDDYVVVQYLNPGFTSSTTGFSNLVVDAYGSLSRGGEIESLGIFSLGASSSQSIVNSAGATALSRPNLVIPSGGKTIPAYWWSVGKVVTGKYVGTISRSNILEQNLTFDLKLGSANLVTIGPLATNTSVFAGNTIEIEFMITCRSLGSSGVFAGFLKIKEYGTTSTVLSTAENALNGTGTTNTNQDMDVDVFVSMSGGSTSTRITIEQAIIEYKN